MSLYDDNSQKITEEEKIEIIKSLPKFKYHPNLYVNDDIVVFKKAICQCCGKETRAYIESMYCKGEINCICLECVKNGSAAEKFDGEFIQDAEKINDLEKTKELYCRTPGYISWQGEYWLACCDDYCEFIGDVGTEELENLGVVEDVFAEYNEKFGCADIEFIKENLTAKGDIAGYLFRCSKCGKYHLYVDME